VAGRHQGQGIAQQRGGIDQRNQLRIDPGMLVAEQAIDSVVKALGSGSSGQRLLS
jgi:hypothetical protein